MVPFREEWEAALDAASIAKLQDILKETLKQQQELGNNWFGKQFDTSGLLKVVTNHPNLLKQWLDDLYKSSPESRRRAVLARSFYEALCVVLLSGQPAKGVELYRQLKTHDERVTYLLRMSGIRYLDFHLFKAPKEPSVERMWNTLLDECRSDLELLKISFLAHSDEAREWLQNRIDDGLQNDIPNARARSVMLLGLDASRTGDALKKIIQEENGSWIGHVAQKAEVHLRRNEFAKHWFKSFLENHASVGAWAAFRLFLACVDKRFLHWSQEVESNSDIYSGTRLTFLAHNLSAIEEHIGKNEKRYKLRETFLAQKILERQVWPWM